MAMTRFVPIIGIWLLAANGALAADCSNNPPFKSRICWINDGYDPTPDPPNGPYKYKSPACNNNSVDPNDANRIKDAFDMATDKLQADLCSIQNIFIANGDSWGKWENPNFPAVNGAPGSGNAFIAINKDDLNKQLKDRKNGQLKKLGLENYGSHTDDGASEKISLLYTLAHEMGHIKWRRDYGSFSAQCSLTSFMSHSWMDMYDGLTYATTSVWRWTVFGAEKSPDQTQPFGTRKNNIPAPSTVTSPQQLADIYQNGVWTALGAANPEEDFVDAYAIGAVMLAKPSFHLWINIANNGPQIQVNDPTFRPKNGNPNSDLKAKYTCVSALLSSTALSRPEKRRHQRRGRY
jgi:hypothetical protein